MVAPDGLPELSTLEAKAKERPEKEKLQKAHDQCEIDLIRGIPEMRALRSKHNILRAMQKASVLRAKHTRLVHRDEKKRIGLFSRFWSWAGFNGLAEAGKIVPDHLVLFCTALITHAKIQRADQQLSTLSVYLRNQAP